VGRYLKAVRLFVAVVQGRLCILKCVCSASEKSCIGFGIGLIGTVSTAPFVTVHMR